MRNDEINIGVNVILEQANKILLGKRLNAAGHGQWGFPGGHVELGEPLRKAAERELLEETGLIADELEFIEIIDQPKTVSPQHYIQINFLCRKFRGDLTLREPNKCEEWKWFDVHNLPDNIFISHKEFIPAYTNKKNFIEI